MDFTEIPREPSGKHSSPQDHLDSVPNFPDPTVPPLAGPPETPAIVRPQAKPKAVWRRRSTLVLFVVLCVWMGMVLAVVPWTPTWTENSILKDFPQVRFFLLNNFVRGAVSGIGLLDIWLGIWEAVQYRERRTD